VREAASIALLYLAMSVIGLGAVYVLGIPLTRKWAATVVGLSPLTGMLICGFVATTSAVVEGGVHPRVVLPASAGLVGIVLVGARRRRLSPWVRRPMRHSRLLLALEAGLLAALIGVGLSVLRLSAATPLREWDGWAIWAAHAHALYVEGTTSGPVFTDPLYAGGHPEYPILYPTLEAMSAHAIGRFDPLLIDVMPALLLLSAAVATWAVLRTVVPPWLAAAVALGVVGAPALVTNLQGNYADGVVALMTALGVLLLAVWLVSASPLALALACLYLAAATLVKAEGAVFAVAALLAALVALSGSRRPLRPLALASVVVLGPALVWYGVAKARGVGDESFDFAALADPGYLSGNADRILRASDAMLGALALSWSLSIEVTVLALLLGFLCRRARPGAFLATWIVLSFAGLVSLYLISTAEINWHLVTSADRVVFSLGLGAFVVAPLIAIDAWDTTTPATPRRSRSATPSVRKTTVGRVASRTP
jgi:hypothetical protein